MNNNFCDEIPAFGGQPPIIILKCMERRYAESFVSKGTIHFSTPRQWQELEETEGPGRGDKLEGLFAVYPSDRMVNKCDDVIERKGDNGLSLFNSGSQPLILLAVAFTDFIKRIFQQLHMTTWAMRSVD